MAGTIAPMIGLDKVYVAKLLTDVVGSTPTYDTPVAMPGVVTASINKNGTIITDYADNRQFWVGNSRGNTEGTFEFVDYDPALIAAMLGQTRANGITEGRPLDQAAYYAIGFRVWIGGEKVGGTYRYVWLLKGKFTIPSINPETKKEQISPKHVTLTAQFVALNGANNVIDTEARNDYDLTSVTEAAWFTAPVFSSGVSTSAVTVGSATGSASAHTITIPFSKGSSETFSLVAPVDNTQIVVIVNSTGLILAGTYTYTASVAGTAPTITIANASIAAVSYSVVVVKITDSNGVLATPKSQDVTPA